MLKAVIKKNFLHCTLWINFEICKILSYKKTTCYVYRIHLKNALQNLDWLVKFDEVMIGDARALSFVSTAGEDLAISNKSNICTWRSQKCYMQVGLNTILVVHVNKWFNWAFLITCYTSVFSHFTFLPSPEPLSQFQPNLAKKNPYRCRLFNFFQRKYILKYMYNKIWF